MIRLALPAFDRLTKASREVEKAGRNLECCKRVQIRPTLGRLTPGILSPLHVFIEQLFNIRSIFKDIYRYV
jgi:hypothetical protein